MARLGEGKLAMKRKYTVAEIDDMRDTLVWHWHPSGGKSASDVEDRLRTYLDGGVDPAELSREFDADY